jgi:hypothetical protein
MSRVLRMPAFLGGSDQPVTMPAPLKHSGLGHAPEVPNTEEHERLKWELAQAGDPKRQLNLDELARKIEATQRRIASITSAIAAETSALHQENADLTALQQQLKDRIAHLVE